MGRLPLVALLLAACAAPAPRASGRGQAWPEADRLMRGPRWRGSDAAYSIDLGEGRALWLFGDSFVSSGSPARKGAAMVRNSVGLQQGRDPSRSTMTFYWGAEGGRPGPFFTAPEGQWLWPGHGIRLGGGLLVFLVRVRAKGGGVFGFEPFGWTVRRIENPDDAPPEWKGRELEAGGAGPILCSGGVLAWRDRLYAYCPDEPRHRVFLARWRLADASAGDLSSPEWWDGRGWGPKDAAAPAFEGGQTELTVHYDGRRFVEVQTIGLGAADVVLRTAPRPEGPWSEPAAVYRPPESDREGVLVYAAKAHPWAAGGGLVLTYATNAWDFARLVEDESLYYPRFVRLPADGAPGAGPPS